MNNKTPQSNHDARKNGNGHHHGNGNGNGNGHQHGSSLKEHEVTLESRLYSPELLERFDLDFPLVDRPKIEDAVRDILDAVGEDTQREGLLDTPKRVAKAYEELLQGYRVDPVALINNAVFEAEGDDMVIVRDIEYHSLCEHHMLPFVGHAYVAYVPNEKIIGLSKIPRIVDMFSQRLQVQERMTRQIAEFVNEVLQPKGVAVVMDGVHMCSMMRGVQKCHSGMTTSTFLGVFKTDRELKHEFMSHIQRAGGKKSLF